MPRARIGRTAGIGAAVCDLATVTLSIAPAVGLALALSACGNATGVRYQLTGAWSSRSYTMTLTQVGDRVTGIAACADVRLCRDETDGVRVTGELDGARVHLALGTAADSSSFSGLMISATAVSGLLAVGRTVRPDTLRRAATPATPTTP